MYAAFINGKQVKKFNGTYTSAIKAYNKYCKESKGCTTYVEGDQYLSMLAWVMPSGEVIELKQLQPAA